MIIILKIIDSPLSNIKFQNVNSCGFSHISAPEEKYRINQLDMDWKVTILVTFDKWYLKR